MTFRLLEDPQIKNNINKADQYLKLIDLSHEILDEKYKDSCVAIFLKNIQYLYMSKKLQKLIGRDERDYLNPKLFPNAKEDNQYSLIIDIMEKTFQEKPDKQIFASYYNFSGKEVFLRIELERIDLKGEFFGYLSKQMIIDDKESLQNIKNADESLKSINLSYDKLSIMYKDDLDDVLVLSHKGEAFWICESMFKKYKFSYDIIGQNVLNLFVEIGQGNEQLQLIWDELLNQKSDHFHYVTGPMVDFNNNTFLSVLNFERLNSNDGRVFYFLRSHHMRT